MSRAKQVFWKMQVNHLPLQEPLWAKNSLSVADCIKKMQTHNVGCVLVGLVEDENHTLKGILTEHDIITRFLQKKIDKKTPIGDIMTGSIDTLTDSDTVSSAIDKMVEGHLSYLPVCHQNKVLGILSDKIITDFIAEHLPVEVLNLPPDRSIVSEDIDGG